MKPNKSKTTKPLKRSVIIILDLPREGIKPGTEQNRKEPELLHNTNVDTGYAIENWCNMPSSLMYGELISQPQRWEDKHPA